MKRIVCLWAMGMLLWGCAPGAAEEGQDAGELSAGITFSGFEVNALDATRMQVHFETSVPTSCEAQYGLSEDALDQVATDPSMTPGELDTQHDVVIEGLMPATTYHWQARAEDGAGNIATSQTMTFQTPTGPDTPLVNVAASSQGSTVTGVSSNFGNAGNTDAWGAANAFDDLLSTEWASAGDGDDAWVQIDLGTQRQVIALRAQSRKMSDGSSIIKSFQLLDELGDVVAGPFEMDDPDVFYDFALPAPLTLRVVRFDVVESTGGNVGAKEFALLAEGP
jgi:hypothetical protein